MHIESALKECFPIEFVPKPNSKKADLDSVLKQLNGASIEAAISAGFELPLLKLPEEGLVRSLITKHKTGDLTMRLTGATCKIEGTPVQELEWKLKDIEKDIRIRIEGSFHEIIDDGYLVRSFKWIENLFNLFILGKASNGNA